MQNRRSVEGEYRVEGSVLDALGLDRQAALELKLKAELHQRILQLVKRRGYSAREIAGILRPAQNAGLWMTSFDCGVAVVVCRFVGFVGS